MTEVELAIYDGWRYLRLDSPAVLSKTPREFSILMSAQVERQYDTYERMANEAMMMRQAYHAKKLKTSQLFKRPVDEEKASKEAEDMHMKAESTMEWLSQFEQFSDLTRREDTDE